MRAKYEAQLHPCQLLGRRLMVAGYQFFSALPASKNKLIIINTLQERWLKWHKRQAHLETPYC